MTDHSTPADHSEDRRQVELLAEEVAALRQRLADSPVRSRELETKVLQLQRLICERLGIEEAGADAEVQELSAKTAVDHLAQELQEKMPKDS